MKPKHFELYELVDKQTYEEEGEAAWGHFDPEALQALDDLRQFFGAPVTVNNWHSGGQFQFRGWRPPWYQPGVTPGSAHRKGKGFDCDVKGYTAFEARKMILASAHDNPLVSRINRMEGGVNWLHWDTMKPPEGHDRIYIFQV